MSVRSALVRTVCRGSWTLGAAVSSQQVGVGAWQWWAPLHQTLDITVYAVTGPALVGGVRELLSVGILLPSIATAIAVVLTAGSREGGVTVRPRTFGRLTLDPPL